MKEKLIIPLNDGTFTVSRLACAIGFEKDSEFTDEQIKEVILEKIQKELLYEKIEMEDVEFCDTGNAIIGACEKGVTDIYEKRKGCAEIMEPETPDDIPDDVQSYNVGNSDYSKHKTQPWNIWEEYHLNPWDADIVKRILRTKQEQGMTEEESRILDYEKIIHICKKRISQLKKGYHF